MPHRRMIALLLAAVAIVLAAPPADAACRWVWECTQQPCRQIHLCDNPTDTPAIRPTEVPPVPPTSVAPTMTPGTPPPGTQACRNANLCDRAGKCKWETVCR